MFQPNRPQWVVIVVTFCFAVGVWTDGGGSSNENERAALVFLAAGALVVWWLEGRRRKRNRARAVEIAREDVAQVDVTTPHEDAHEEGEDAATRRLAATLAGC